MKDSKETFSRWVGRKRARKEGMPKEAVASDPPKRERKNRVQPINADYGPQAWILHPAPS